SDYAALSAVAETLSAKVSRQLKTQNRAAIRVVLKLKFANHRLITRSRSLSAATQMQHDIFAAVNELLKPETGKGQSYRLLGVGVDLDALDTRQTDITPASLLDLVDEKRQKKNRLEAAIDQLQEKLGEGVLKTGRQFKPQDK
ncbi:MAG: DNA polymerase IV, partial [Candidatus Puniceispirillaceae bacterium]